MITSIEIAKLLQKRERANVKKGSFDAALSNLGVGLPAKIRTKNHK